MKEGRFAARRILRLLAAGQLLLGQALAAAATDGDVAEQTELTGHRISLRVNARGSALTRLRAAESGADLLAPDGHYLCFDRWGPVTEEESALGIPFHGEAAAQTWRLSAQGGATVHATTTLPFTGWKVLREVMLSANGPVYKVTTTITNPAPVSRPYNAVEHVTLADRWSDESTVLMTNAVRGFLHFRGQPVPDSDFEWPHATLAGRTWDLRGPLRIPGRVLASLVFPDDAVWAWVCLANRASGEILGYCWRTTDYPWLNLWWRTNRDGVAVGRAVEPGTTGLHQPMPVLLAAGKRLGRPLVQTLTSQGRDSHALWGFAAVGPAGTLPQVEVIHAGTTVQLLRGSRASDWRLVLPSSDISK